MNQIKTNNGLKGGLLKGKPHYDSEGNSLGGIKAIVTDSNNKPVELEGEEVIINKKSVKSEKVLTVKGTPKEILSTINQLDGNGVAIGDENAEILAKYRTGGKVGKSEINKLSINNFEEYLEKKYNSKVELGDYKKYIYLSRIEVPKEIRDLGIGSEIMSEIIDYADYNDKKITLTPSTDYGATSISRLKEFYKKFGFIENKGKNKDFEISQLMYRLPEANKLKTGGELIKRADGSYSRRGLYDNIRDNIGSGRKPTKQMLEQEAKIKSKYHLGGSIKPDFSKMSKAEIKEFYNSPEGKKLDAETYSEWKKLVNMTKSELEKFYNSEEGKKAGLTPQQANEQGIDSGRESARWIMKMKDVPYTEWSSDMWIWAKKQISFIKRMTGMKGDLYDENGNKTRKHTALLIWGNNPERKFNLGGGIENENLGKIVYRGGIGFSKYFSTSKDIANDYAKNRGGEVKEYLIINEAKIINYENVPNIKFKGINDWNIENYSNGDDIKKFFDVDLENDYCKAEEWAKENNYDAIQYPTEGEIRIINQKVIIDNSQKYKFGGEIDNSILINGYVSVQYIYINDNFTDEICLITYNSGGQNNLNINDTMNATEMLKLFVDELDMSKNDSMQIIYDHRFNSNRIDSLEELNYCKNNFKTIIVDRDRIEFSNFNKIMEQGGGVEETNNIPMEYKEEDEDEINIIGGFFTPRKRLRKLSRTIKENPELMKLALLEEGGLVEKKEIFHAQTIGKKYEIKAYDNLTYETFKNGSSIGGGNALDKQDLKYRLDKMIKGSSEIDAINYVIVKDNILENKEYDYTDYESVKSLTKSLIEKYDNEKDSKGKKNKGTKINIETLIDSLYRLVNENPSKYLQDFIIFNNNLPKSFSLSSYSFFQKEDYSNNQGIINYLIETNKNPFEFYDIVPYKFPKTKNFKVSPNDSVFMDIHDEFIGNDPLRPIMTGTYFSEKGVVSTNAHILLFTKNRGGEDKFEGVYCHTKKCIEENKDVKIEGKFPNYEMVIPSTQDYSKNINAEYLLTYLKNANKYKIFNAVTHATVFTFETSEGFYKIGVNTEFLARCIEAMIELGHKEISLNFIDPNRAITITPKGKTNEDARYLGTDFALCMPIKIDLFKDIYVYIYDLDTNCSSYEYNSSIFCFDLQQVERESFKKEIKEIKELKEQLKSELTKGTKHEMEHLETLKKVAEREITPEQAVVETAKTHIAENPEYYEDLAKMELEALRDKLKSQGYNVTIPSGGNRISVMGYGKGYFNAKKQKAESILSSLKRNGYNAISDLDADGYYDFWVYADKPEQDLAKIESENEESIPELIEGLKILAESLEGAEKKEIEDTIEGLKILLEIDATEVIKSKEPIESFKDEENDVFYTVEQDENGKWTVYSVSPKWNKRNEYPSAFTSKEDAIMIAKLDAGIEKEEDPEKKFMNKFDKFAEGGELENKSMIFEPTEKQEDEEKRIMENQFGKNI